MPSDSATETTSGSEPRTSHAAPTSHTSDVTVEHTVIHVLEMEDVLFHLNSAVMMPRCPSVGDTTDDPGEPAEAESQVEYPAAIPEDEGAQTSEQQEQVSGVAALALVFKTSEFHPEYRIIVAGHTDTSGGIELNYRLANDRALGVWLLLLGREDPADEEEEEGLHWAETARGRHRIEDYQQIMTHYALAGRVSGACDPQGVDNTWGSDTSSACEAFFRELSPDTADSLIASVRSASDKEWPVAAWQLVYDLYMEDLKAALRVDGAGLAAKRSTLQSRFVDPHRRHVACGESYPIDSAERDHYRSQQNRRVEILFIDEQDVPGISCPADLSRKHRTNLDGPPIECPLWHEFVTRDYLDPNDLAAEQYFIQFKYYDRVLDRIADVPDGLEIKAYDGDGNEIPAVVEFAAGIYCVRVQFDHDAPAPETNDWHFAFEAPDGWICTEAREGEDEPTPEIVRRPVAEVNELAPAERQAWYDLPPRWSSVNYWTRYDDDLDTGDRFAAVINEHKNLAPAGTERLSWDQPLVFSLEDIVLLDAPDGTQDIKDANHLIPAGELDLSSETNRVSRVKILMIDRDTGFLKLYKTDDARPSSARIPLPENLLHGNPETYRDARIIHFRDGFYTIGDKRTVETADWAEQGFVLGARAAVRDDSDFHVELDMYEVAAEFRSTGDHALHYFHHLHMDESHPVSFLLSYVSASFMVDPRGPSCPRPAQHQPVPSAAEVRRMVDEGVYSTMDHWNRKRFFMEETAEGDATTIIRAFFFFDERETFRVTPPAAGFDVNIDDRTAHAAFFNHASLRTAQGNALGGRSRFLAFVSRNTSGNWGPAWQWAIRSEGVRHYSLFLLNRTADQAPVGNYTGVPVDEHGERYGPHTMAHEYGHALGYPDEYVNSDYSVIPSDSVTFPGFDQFFASYSMTANQTSMMLHNGAPRTHHCWYALHRINSGSAAEPLSLLLEGRTFSARLQRDDNWNYVFNRHLDEDTDDHHRKPDDFLVPMKTAAAHTLSASPAKRISLALHDAGRDASACRYFHDAQTIEYQGVLLVRPLMSVEFVGSEWTPDEKRNRIHGLNDEWLLWSATYRLVGGARDLRNVFVHFLPGFSGDTADGRRHYRLQFSRNSYASGDRIPNNAGRLTIFSNIPADEIVKYMLNTGRDRGHAQAIDALRDWVNGELGEAFRVETI